PADLYNKNLFPEGFRPLSHPLHSTGHQLFPQMWTRLHTEHERFDVDFDIPEAYLPEFPPPLFLTTRPDLGDVSQGHEITQANFRELFDGILTPADQLQQEVALLREEIRIKDARMARIPPGRRPHYQPVERLAILELRAARSWSLAQTSTVFQVT